MRNFEILILIICAVTITYSTKHDKKGIKKKLPKITSENLEEEAKIDIASLLKDSKVNAVRNDGHNDADYISPIREHDPITARTQGKQSSQLIDQINKLINKVDNSAQRKGFDRDNEKNKHVKWYEDEREWDKEKTLRNRYHQFMKSLAVSHRNSVKNRVDDFLDVGVTEGEPGKLFLPKVQHMMKKMDLDHRGVVKERYIDDDSSGLRLRSSDDVIEVITQRFDDTKKLPPVEKNNNAAEVFLPTLASKREEEDVLFSDLMGGNLKVSKRGPQIDKAPTPNEDLNFNLVLRTGSLLNDSPGKTHRFDDRFRRSAFTQAGYTQDPDICKTYNENLMKLWSNLSKLFNVTDTPNERALHNIAIMIQAYLDHQNAKQTTETYKVKVEPPRDRTGEIILKVKKMVDDDEASAKAISRLIIKNMKPFYDDVENSECQKMNEESLTSSVDLLYRTYLENFDCRNEDDGSGLILRKRGGKNIQTLNSKWQTTNDDDRPAVKSILGEDELYKEITKGQVPRQRPGRKFRRIFRRSQTTNNGLFRSTAKNVNGSDKPKRVRLHAKPLAKKLRKSLLKTEMDNKTRCERFAIRKLSVSLRPVIDRFMSLLECELDNTLRSLKHEKVPTTPYNLYATVKESYKTEKPSLRQLKTRKDTSQSLDHVTRKTEIRNRYDMLTDNDNSLYEQTDEYPSSKQISAERITGNDFMSSIVDSFKVSDNDRSDGDNKTNDDAMFNDDRSNNKKAESKVKNRADDDREISFTDLLPETGLISRNQEKALRSAGNESPTENVTEADNPDKTNLRNDDRFNFGNSNQNQGAVNNYEDIKKFLNNARDASLKTPEFAVPFALDTSRGE
ncbi:uncharacterized protein LOC113505188 isoform X2 [Trichoplusia ni]|uniref:Uncharacterized protein LOC113505188 isoform X2 n=1 Tax=Trichoplusia ni TaxID=7111 RepID=A0A7E5WS00_TRINI|nr:uncharacterized protein LOC113505188 isoform X2 [Trichoplusia ni]